MTTPRNAANDGRGLQKFLDALFLEYERLGLACIRKVDPPVRVIGFGKKRQVIFLPNPWLDYAGVINGGRMVAIEAKSTLDPVLPISTNGTKTSGIKEAQQEAAMRLQRLGAVTFYLWQCRADMRIVTPNQVAATLRTRKSVRWCDAMPIARGPGALAYDPLASYHHISAPDHPEALLPSPYPGA